MQFIIISEANRTIFLITYTGLLISSSDKTIIRLDVKV